MTAPSIEPMDPAAFVYLMNGDMRLPAMGRQYSGQYWYLWQTSEPNTYVVAECPGMEADADDDGFPYWTPTWDKLLVVAPSGEREATDYELDTWADFLRDDIRAMWANT